ncbi:hypothetical protein ANN_19198 [Periplaneta americana]|uniref:THAP-type domain-containing protein n=1 Tax=Periplaneta americana TaxID=6978 RepID=A0ABQ8S9V7_PERAM|nr:hypothetical protein ANN_19198 [Periplaneta americana]
MPNCVVSECQNYSRKTKGSSVIYHTFPSDPKLRKVWEIKCYRKDEFNLETARICSEHFTSDSYERDLKAELLNIPAKKKLKLNAQPSLNLPVCYVQNSEINSARSKRVEERACRKKVLSEVSEQLDARTTVRQDDPLGVLSFVCSLENEGLDLKKENEELRIENEKLKLDIEKLESKLKELQIKYKNQAHFRVNQNSQRQRKCLNRLVNGKVKHLLAKVFTPGQIKMLISGKRKQRWEEQDIIPALAQRAISDKLYNHLRSQVGIPLPSVATLQRWTKKLPFSPGILTPVLKILKEQGMSLSEMDKLSVLLFDEMNVNGVICYDHEDDSILGPHRNAQIVMIRGLTGEWKQPIYYDFDKTMNRELLFEIITEIEVAGFRVVAIVSDLGGGNRRL